MGALSSRRSIFGIRQMAIWPKGGWIVVTQITDGMSDARSPDWDKSGKYLYFTASTDLGLSSVGFNMSSNRHPVTRRRGRALRHRHRELGRVVLRAG